ncbi:dynein heavy chain and region D6 of dynein motor-domain-containing protein [Blastocladiella britannica]|nr:dynein heavy chain and region D6 of dynein motor-domain-containing protein [Blastocladiella britannica]
MLRTGPDTAPGDGPGAELRGNKGPLPASAAPTKPTSLKNAGSSASLRASRALQSTTLQLTTAAPPDPFDTYTYPLLELRFIKLVTLVGFQRSMWGPAHAATLKEFAVDPNCTRLFLYLGQEMPAKKSSPSSGDGEQASKDPAAEALVTVFVMTKHLPQHYAGDLMYVLKNHVAVGAAVHGAVANNKLGSVAALSANDDPTSPGGPIASAPLTAANLLLRIQYGTIGRSLLDSLVVLMNGVYVPLFLDNRGWPETVRKDFAGQLHKFMAVLTDTAWHSQGHTVLYVPKEKLPSVDQIGGAKDVIQRLESLLVHWTRQIKEVINNQNTSETSETAGPLDEIAFWRSRCEDLSGIRAQINRAEVQEIILVLEAAKSSYLDQFHRLSQLIEEGSMQAQDNLKFLSLLTPSCQELAKSEPRGVASILPRVLMTIRLIWANSRFYNSKERITSLLRKISNEIIRRCSAKISLDAIFHGDTAASVISLQDSVACGEQWKLIYSKMVAHVAQYTKRPWDFDHSSIFAQIDAFVQRCRDLLELCEGQMQFARKLAPGGKKLPIPIFGGSKGAEIGKSLEDIEKSFESQLSHLWQIRDLILDVKATRWHDDYNSFKQAVKDLEVMLQNVITSAFDAATTVQIKVELLEIFSYIAKRDGIKRIVERKTVDVYQSFLSELGVVKSEFESHRKSPAVLSAHPPFAGAAMWARTLNRRVSVPMAVLNGASEFLPETPFATDVRNAFDALSSSLEEYTSKSHGEWIAQLDKNLGTQLDTPLMARRPDGFLELQFSKQVLTVFAEITYWQKLKFDIPYYVQEVFAKREELRVLRENVLLVIRDYNSILEVLSKEEILLFRERVRFLDRKINPGLTSLTWSAKGVTDYFIRECRKHASEVQRVVTSFMDANRQMTSWCKQIADTSFWYIEPKKIYELPEFEAAQVAHRTIVRNKLQVYHANIVRILGTMFDAFRNDGKDVHMHWANFVTKIDSAIEDALRTAVKRSLLELSKAINGDAKGGAVAAAADGGASRSEVQPLFKVNVVLDNTKMEFSPALLRLEAAVNSAAKELVSIISVVPRLAEVLVQTGAISEVVLAVSANVPNRRFFDVISAEDDIIKIFGGVQLGMSGNATACQVYIKHWDSYREIWEINKDAFIRRYAKLKPAMSTFDADINRYNEVANNAQKEETLSNVNFVRLDCSPLKHAIVTHCHLWQSKLTTLLNNNANGDLVALFDMFTKKSEKMRSAPRDLDDLTSKIQLVNELKSDLANIEAQFAPIQEQYMILEKYEVQVKDEERAKLEALPTVWAVFKETMIDSDKSLQENKEKFRAKLLSEVEEFKVRVAALTDDIRTKGPFSSASPIDKAQRQLADYLKQIDECVSSEESIRKGLSVFSIDHTPAKDLPLVRNEVETLLGIWAMSAEWTGSYSVWKGQQFLTLELGNVEEIVGTYIKKLTKLQREAAAKDWEVLTSFKDRVMQVRRILPVLQDLRNPALRPRHWEQLVDEIGKAFDPNSPDSTLDKVLELGLDQYGESIGAMSGAATKELSIEEGLAAIKEAWHSMELDIVPYKDKYSKLRSTDAVFELLEDNQVTLSSMKASKYYVAFGQTIDFWEKTLSRIVEVVDVLLQVQKQWMYLENIFIGAEDIRKQLPRESAVFDLVNTRWKELFAALNANKNIVRAIELPGILDMLQDMFDKLEKVQKSLDMYLETKRQFFPRFYFLSNDDLLEILGQARDPPAVQPHMKKCFDGINKLELTQVGPDMRKHWEAIGMHSPDGEYVPFQIPVSLEGPVEGWLQEVESAMRVTLRNVLIGCLAAMKKSKRDKWLTDWPGQLLILSGQAGWTADCTKALTDAEKGDKHALKDLKKKQISMLKKLADLVRTNLSKVDRKKLIALITTEVHSRDVIERMCKNNLDSVNAFEWLSQLRFFWDKEDDDCIIRQTNTRFRYGYEYLGNSGRLVITPLTDRCYMTLTTALHLYRGGSPQGPAGTGKTETVKDLGKGLGKLVIIQNCSSDLDYKSMGRMFSGLAQTGAWGCFDEFNRIDIEVLSVVALQISCVLNAIQRRAQTFIFEGQEIKLNWTTGIFITMNPTYAGRVELPDNLKSLFRPVAMMSPDTALIAEIMLFAEGFNNTKIISKKVDTLYKVSAQQLSKQDHYDFGLRPLTSALRAAGVRRRQDFSVADETVIVLTMMEMNIPKLTAEDGPLFMGILNDLFPGVEAPRTVPAELRDTLVKLYQEKRLQVVDAAINKIIQLYDTKATRHSVMVVGATGVGKSTAWKTLQQAHNILHKTNAAKFSQVHTHIMNPKALTLGELYGEVNLQTSEWTDGILSSIVRTVCMADESGDYKWVVFDGPVDTIWIENMNSVMDDNKVLTLTNGERIALPETVSLLFEVENLAAASPATVSRCGMLYMDYAELGWRPVITSWIQCKENEPLEAKLTQLVEKYLPPLLKFRKQCTDIVQAHESTLVRSITILFDALVAMEQTLLTSDKVIEMWFLFAVIWAVGGPLRDESRHKFDMFLREIDGQFPSKDTVYEYFVSTDKESWLLWESRLPENWRYPTNVPFYNIFVPTVDTLRVEYLAKALIKAKQPCLVVGDVGVGKTSLLQSVLANVDDHTTFLSVPFSARTTADRLQQIIEGKLEKRTKNVFVPVGGKHMICFIDDLNMPQKDAFGSQAPLEFLRHWMDYGYCFDKQKQLIKHFNEIQLVAAMGPPGGGRNPLSSRVQSRFHLIHMAFPNEVSLNRIFSTIINQKLQDFEEELKPLGGILTQCTMDIYHTIVAQFLPTPTRMHYLFNLRDISRVFQGMLRCHKDYYDSKDALIKLWVHEVFRVFHDRMIDQTDKDQFIKVLDDRLIQVLQTSIKQLFPSKHVSQFGDFLTSDKIYQEMAEQDTLKRTFEERLQDYNAEPGYIQLDLVLFRDAIEHMCRVIRVLGQPSGHVLLIGVGGSGRQSLSSLAAYVAGIKTFRIQLSKNYRLTDFREDLKTLYRRCGCDGQETAFLLSDTQIVNEAFLEDFSSMLSSGEVPNLFSNDEMGEIREAVRPIARAEKRLDTPDALYSLFLERVRNNLHCILCLSPVGDAFRNRLRMFPALVNCSTIDWFSDWPEDALLEVASKYLNSFPLDPSINKLNIASVFTTAHLSVSACSRQMRNEIKRYSYVTPINYLELVTNFCELYKAKKKSIGDLASKLSNGLRKLDDTRENVEKISVELEVARKQVAQFQKQCEDYLVIIVQQKREADEQAKQVSARSEKLQVEEEEVKAVADAARADLDQALPALEAATKALESLNKKDLNEIRSYGKPPPLVEKVMEAVMVLKKNEPTWDEAKRQLGNPNFIKQLIGFDKDNISDKILKRTSQYCAEESFQPDTVGKVSGAAKSLCMWVRAMETYANIFRTVAPKRERLRMAQETLDKKQATLREAKEKLQEIQNKLANLQQQYDEKLALKEKLKKESDMTELKLSRAEQLVSGLSGEKSRWETSIKTYQEAIGLLPGDCLLAAAFMSYSGPFNTAYRSQLLEGTWLKAVRALEIPCSPDFNVCKFLGNEAQVRQWNIQGLPTDAFSIENGIIVTSGRRWPLLIDPQSQASTWLKNMESKRGLKIVDMKQSDLVRTLESSIQYGIPVLVQGIMEVIDPALDPLLNKAVTKKQGRLVIRLGDKEVDFNPEFKLYLTTKLANPHYSPEIFAKATIVNFAVKERGLEDQLLGIVVRKEKPDLEDQKDKLVTSVASAKKQLLELEDEILGLLSSSEGSLLDDEKMVNTLKSSKSIAEQVKEQLVVSQKTEADIDLAREQYRPSAARASVLYFVLNDLSGVDPMYQFSLESYVELFEKSISKSKKSDDIAQRIEFLNQFHTFSVYKYACRGLFEKDKLLFSFHMTAKILVNAGKLNKDLYEFFLRGGLILDRDSQAPNPCAEWLSDVAWDNVCILDTLPGFQSLISSLEQNEREWRTWFMSSEPEKLTLPGDWHSRTNEFQRIVLVRSFRPDRVIFCARNFVASNLGQAFTDPPILDMQEAVNDSAPHIPLVFILSSGVDPISNLMTLAQSVGMSDRFHHLSLGQGQAPKATHLLQEGVRQGHWVFLANCHLSISWMPSLEKVVEGLAKEQPHPDFRLWLSSSPHPQFPITILHSAIKMTTEPPKGLRANMVRLYTKQNDDAMAICRKNSDYKRLLFGLSFFHSVVLERKKFLTLGWNNPVDFNDSDYEICVSILSLLLDDYPETPWDALRYLIAEANYGGRITDDWDRRVLKTYIAAFFCPEALSVPQFKLSTLPMYYVPDPTTAQAYREFISTWPGYDRPEAFGQHPNADIASQIRESNNLLSTLVSLQPQVQAGGGMTREDKVLALAADLGRRVPADIDYEYAYKLAQIDQSPTLVVLLQEIKRYNWLLRCMRSSLSDLQNGIKGIVLMTPELEEMFACIFDARVPPEWAKAYPSVKMLAMWVRDLGMRVDFFNEWAKGNEPKLFWLSAFTFPTGFLTAVLQKTARKLNVSIDSLSWEFSVLQVEDDGNAALNQAAQIKDGIVVRGVHLEGAGWDRKSNALCEPRPMELLTALPPIHFRPNESKRKSTKGLYACPVYYYPIRAEVKGRASFVIAIDLRTGAIDSDFFIKRGTACILSTQ